MDRRQASAGLANGLAAGRRRWHRQSGGQAEFILRRLYPEMPESWFADVLSKLAAKHVAGEWHGFQRP